MTKRIGGFLFYESKFIVPQVLKAPQAIFRGLLSDDDEDRFCDVSGWLCYLGVPNHYYNNDGVKIASTDGRPYLVFVNVERVAYNWRFDDDMALPDSHEHRFKERLL